MRDRGTGATTHRSRGPDHVMRPSAVPVAGPLLGRGSTATVHAGRADDGTPVALKVLRPEHAANPAARRRFVREAELQAAVSHPAVLPLLGEREHDGRPCHVLPLVDGPTLRQLSRAGALTPARSLVLLAQVAGGLDAVHAAGLRHGDVKPANVVVDEASERAWLSDFGAASRVGESSGGPRPGLVGTVAYLAPELALGEPGTRSSDRYAFAAMAFECLTGRPPFLREHEVAVMLAHVDDAPPSASALNPALPPAVDAVLARGLAKDPAERWPTATALVTTLAHARW